MFFFNEKVVVLRLPKTWGVLLYGLALHLTLAFLITTIFFNGVAVATIWNSGKLKERVANFIIWIQSITDLANGVILIPLSTVHFAGDFIGRQLCACIYVSRKIRFLLFFYSMTTMSAMCSERYMGVLHPFVHRSKVTKTILVKYIIFVCCLQTLLYSINFLNGVEIERPFFAVNTFLFLALLTFTYTSIFCVRMKRMKRSVGAKAVGVAEDENINTKPRMMKKLKILKSCFFVVFTSLMCLMPAVMLFGVLNLKTSFLTVTFRRWSYILMMLNPTTNSLIFFWSNKALRAEGLSYLRSMFNRIRRKSSIASAI